MKAATNWMPLVAAVALAMAGCSSGGYYDDRSDAYTQAKSAEPLVLPAGSQLYETREAMPVPKANRPFRKTGDEFTAPRPQPSVAERDYVERRSMGDARWLTVNDPPEAVWPRVVEFGERQRLTVTDRNDTARRLTTSDGMIAVNDGLGATSEVRCEQNTRALDGCLNALAGYLDARGQTAMASNLSRREAAGSAVARLVGGESNRALLIDADAEQAWAELSHLLERDFDQPEQQLLDQDAAGGDFQVAYLPLAERHVGMIDRLLGDQTPRRVRLSVVPAGEQQARLTVTSVGEPALDDDGVRDLLGRLSSLLR
ncbi:MULTISPECIES: outer membrane protein assembly factor BamC [Halomonadaceae]|uniref:outer membrane protein assembly factor BamC n=1 Tax=Halomonadaceae TaxID=28256 RepID=UPI0015841F4E|nr:MULTISPECIES: outer membrane protein assembly factor BamC [Halomonas]MDI4637115.1 outer membrane protein assembly factor BamC [Halomonas sp. BMC7]NUJ58282.1 outer membrane protein assembly factor BamC [Halomonas taeanensis]